MNLCVWHSPTVEPHVDEVELALQGLSARTYEHDVIHVGTVQVDAIVVLLAHVARYEAFSLQRVLFHDASLDGFLNLVVEFLHAADANLLAGFLVAPDRQWRSPVAATAEVPVVQVLQPLTEAAGTR